MNSYRLMCALGGEDAIMDEGGLPAMRRALAEVLRANRDFIGKASRDLKTSDVRAYNMGGGAMPHYRFRIVAVPIDPPGHASAEAFADFEARR